MPTRIVPVLMLILMLLHGACGCGWHHAHAGCGAHAHDESTAEHRHPAETPALAEGDAAEMQTCHTCWQMPTEETCSADKCDFVSSNRPRWQGDAGAMPSGLPVLAGHDQASALPCILEIKAADPPRPCAARRHAACSVWLL